LYLPEFLTIENSPSFLNLRFIRLFVVTLRIITVSDMNDKSTSVEIGSLKDKEKIKILFVCLGNICRSPAAQGVMQRLVDERGLSSRYELDSCGFYGGHAGDLPDKRMRVHASRRGYDLTHRSRVIRPWDFDDFDLIVGMDDRNISDLLEAAPSADAQRKVVRMIDFARCHPCQDCVPDPYYDGAQGFELVLDLLEDACAGLFDEIEK
jgi:protein-tyrosine phosphatase